MSLPYFPMFPADFEADTSHLSLEEDGAYNRLLRLLWMSGDCTLPDDPAWLARRMRVDPETFDRVVAPVIAEFLRREIAPEKPGLSPAKAVLYQKRLRDEWRAANVLHRRRVAAGKKGGRRPQRSEKPAENGEARLKPGLSPALYPEPEPEPSLSGGGGARARVREGSEKCADPPRDATLRERLLVAMGHHPDGITASGKVILPPGQMAEVERWLALPGLNPDLVVAEVTRIAAERGSPPATVRYFTPALERLSGEMTLPPLEPKPGIAQNGGTPRFVFQPKRPRPETA